MASKQTEELKKIQAQAKRQHGPGHGPVALTTEKPKHLKKSLMQLVRYLGDFKWKLILVLIFAVASTAFAIVSPKILGNMTNQIVDDYISIKTYDAVMEKMPKGTKLPAGTTLKDLTTQMSASQPEQASKINEQIKQVPEDQLKKIENLDLSKKPTMDFSILGQTAFLLIGLYILSALFGYIQGWIIAGITQKITFRLRKSISEKINTLPLKYFDTHPFGDVLSRITNDVDTISQSLGQSLTQIVTSITMIVGILGMMISISLSLTGIAVVTVPLSFILIMLIVKRSQKYFKLQQKSLGDLNGQIEEVYAGHNVVKVFGGEKQALKEFNHINKKLHGSAWKSQFLSGLMFPIMNFIGNLGYVAVAVLGGWMAINGHVRIGDIQAFMQYIQQFNQPLMQMANIANVIQSTAAASERVFEFLGEDNETADAEDLNLELNVLGNIEFSHVKFGYDKKKTVIKDFSASVKAGQTVAIVGPTGAGKTTMVNLLMRFYDPQSGSIKIDGVDTRTMSRADVRRQFAMVLQDTWLFNGTVRENLAYGDLNASDAQIHAAAKTAHVDHFIRSLSHGYDTVLDEDAENISAGEKQLLTIGRAMLADAPMLILDEATSSVDTRTEVLIQKAMNELMKGRTSFVIAHRLSTIRDADLILVMKEGDIIEHGTHDELIAEDGFYANLYNSQFVED